MMQTPRQYVKTDEDFFRLTFFQVHLIIWHYLQWDIDSNTYKQEINKLKGTLHG